jgi:zinc transporter ZupT
VERFKLNQKVLRLLLAFSGAYLLTVAFTHIIPTIFHSENNTFLGYFVLIGFFIQLIIEYISGGAEHGHGHCDDQDHKHQDDTIKISPYALLIGISLHAFFEGMPFAMDFHDHGHESHSLLIGIVIHKVPIAIVLMGLFLSSGMTRMRAYTLILVFALVAPLGAFMGGIIGESLNIDIELYYQIIMALLVGIFLHVSTAIIFESNTSHKFNFVKFLIIIIGVGLAVLSNIL